MTQNHKFNRRKMIGLLAASGVTMGLTSACSTGVTAHTEKPMKVDGTPMQFFPKNGPDAEPFVNDIEKYPKCPYCGMSRKMWNHSRHLVHYSDDMVDPTCSLHCAALSLSLNLDRFPKAIYAADFGAESQIKPLVNVEQMIYLVGSTLKGTMSGQSKMAFASKEIAQLNLEKHKGELENFDNSLTAAYASMAKDSIMIRKKRAAKRKKMLMS